MIIGIYDPYLDALGGGEKYMLTAASFLSKEHTVSIFWDQRDIKEDIQNRFPMDLSRVHFTKNIFSQKIPFFKRLILTKKYDVIFYLSDGSIPFVSAKNLILHFQFPIEWVDTSAYGYRLKRSRISEIIVNSRYTKKFIDKKFSWDSKIVYPPVEVNELLGETKKEKIILTVGRYNPLPDGSDFKKQTFLIDTFKKLYDKGVHEWKLIVVTSYQERDLQYVDRMEDAAKGYPIEIKRNLPHNLLFNIYKKAAIYWHAAGFGENLHHNPERAEHFGIATVEAMAAGAVPIVINAGGQKEIVINGENGMLWQTQEELVTTSMKLIEDKKLLQVLAINARERSKNFSEEIFSQSIRRIIDEQ